MTGFFGSERSVFWLAVCAPCAVISLVALDGQSAPQSKPELQLNRRYTGENANTPIGSVGTALLGTNGLVYVMDPENRVIHVLDGAKQVRQMSRSGRGPGEMQRTSQMTFLGDSIAFPDGSLSRVTILSLKGNGLRTVSTTTATAPGVFDVHAFAYGPSALVMVGNSPTGPAAGRTSDIKLFLRPHGTSKIDLIAHLQRGTLGMNIPAILRGQPANMPREQPFVYSSAWAVAREGGGIVVLDTAGRAGASINLRLRQWSNDGKLVRTCLISRPVQPLTNAAYEAGLLTVGPPSAVSDIVKVDWAVVRRLVVRPPSLPPFRSVRFASDGTVWIRTEASFRTKFEEYLVVSAVGCTPPRVLVLPLETIVEDARGNTFITSGFVDDAPAIDTWRY